MIGNSGVDPVRLGAALTEDNLRHIQAKFEESAEEAGQREEILDDLQHEMAELAEHVRDRDPAAIQEMARLRKEYRRISVYQPEDAARFAALAKGVFSVVGKKGSPFATDAAYQKFLEEPRTKEALARHRDLWRAVIEPQDKAAMLLDPEMELPSRGLQTGARINLRAEIEGERTRDVVRAGGRGNLLGTLRKKSPFACGLTAAGRGTT